jgi:hypothetical protein
VCFGGSDLSDVWVLTGPDEERPDSEGGRIYHGVSAQVGLPSPIARIRP